MSADSFFKKISDFANKPTPGSTDLFLLEDGVTGLYYNVTKSQLAAIFGSPTNKVIGEQQVISGVTLTLANTPIAGTLAGYLNGNRCGIGAGFRILSIVGNTITFDANYTGADFLADYEY